MTLEDLHTHTRYCDGKNTPEEMILSAIEKGLTDYGFSEHGYTAFDLRYCLTLEKTELYKKEMRKICVESKKLNIPLEINFLGIRDGRAYPRMLFWELAREEQCPVTFGFDAHDVNSAFDGESFVKAMEMVEKYKLNYIGKPDIVKL